MEGVEGNPEKKSVWRKVSSKALKVTGLKKSKPIGDDHLAMNVHHIWPAHYLKKASSPPPLATILGHWDRKVSP